jgi:uncharacterized protein
MSSTTSETRRYFFCRLIPPRPTFATDMTPAEAQVMRAHVGYWTELASQGTALAFGPVADPKGPWGLGIIAAPDAEAMARLQTQDPAILGGIGMRYETLPILQLVVGALPATQ